MLKVLIYSDSEYGAQGTVIDCPSVEVAETIFERANNGY